MAKSLGRGLGALLGEDTVPAPRIKRVIEEQTNESSAIAEIPIDKIIPNPNQPRRTFDPESLQELGQSIERLGLIQPITVRKEGDAYQIISGERRYRAAKSVGLTALPAYVRETDAQGVLEMALVENIQREDLNPIETALGFQQLIEECKLTQEKLSENIGISRSQITNFLRLLKLPAEVQLALRERAVSVGHARALINIEDSDKQIAVTKRIITEDLSVRVVEQIAQEYIKNNIPSDKKTIKSILPEPQNFTVLKEKLDTFFGPNVKLKIKPKGVITLTIDLQNDYEIEKLISQLSENGLNEV